GNCFTGMKTDGAAYVREHNPFISMKNISNNSTRCANIVNADQFEVDLASNDLPQFVFYVPDRFNDAHETNLTHATSWFQPWFDDKLQNVNFTANTLSLVVFDESHGYGVNHIYASLIGSPVTSGANEDTTNYTHYSFTKTVEENWSLGNLGRNDVNAEPFSKFLRVNNINNITSTSSVESLMAKMLDYMRSNLYFNHDIEKTAVMGVIVSFTLHRQ
ncbi:10760_t:CDS:2, partial [Paraglomus occultum]